ncbi:MAG: site-specific integrase, partial [Anaerolineaceae bacterium]|nr:site-specific integrase [Anaerolineaceae bacterium]
RYIYKYLIPHIGEITLGNLSPLGIDQYYRFLFTEAGKSASTIKHLHSVLHRALQYAVEKHILPNNPADGATLPRHQKPEKKIWSLDEIRTFLNAAKLFPYEIVYYLAITTGMRQSELFGLRWEDLDWDKETIHVQRQIVREKKGVWNFGPLKSKSANRIIPLSKKTMEKLKIHRAYVNILPEISRGLWQENNLLLPTERGLPLYQAVFEPRW